MPAIPLPQFDSLVAGDDYNRPTGPTDDAASTAGAESSRIPNLPQGQPSPLTAISLATETRDATAMGSFLLTNLHDDNWLDPTQPHISPESQKG